MQNIETSIKCNIHLIPPNLQPEVLIQNHNTLGTKNNCDKINVFSERSNNIIKYIRLRLDITLPEPFISLRITGWELFISGLPILKEPATTNRSSDESFEKRLYYSIQCESHTLIRYTVKS